MQETCAPLRHGKHDSPPGDSDGLLGGNGGLDLVELLLNPLIVGAIGVQLPEHPHGLVFAINLDQVARGFREEHDAAYEDKGREGLEGEREAPLKLAQVSLSVRRSVSYPRRAVIWKRGQ